VWLRLILIGILIYLIVRMIGRYLSGGKNNDKDNINDAGISAKQNFFAGTYVCNNVLYGLLRYISKNDLDIKAGFIHVPLLDSQDPEGMELEKMIDAVEIAIKTSLNTL